MRYHDDIRKFYKLERAEGNEASSALRSAKHRARYDPQSKSNKLDILPSRYSAYEGEEITELPNGWKIKVAFQYDQDSGPPWKDCDGMGVIEECCYRPGEYGEYDDWILNSDRGWYRYYDWKATLPEAMRDGWNTKPYNFHSTHEQAMAAMRSTYEFLRRWCNDDWWYVGMIVTLLDENDDELDEESCWGYESESIDYLCSEARSWAAHMIKKQRREHFESTDAWRQMEMNLCATAEPAIAPHAA